MCKQQTRIETADVIIIGAGASGLMCAIEAGRRQRKVLVIDHAEQPGQKLLMSGGGRCNFTNYEVSHENYISHNPSFCRSALSRYTTEDFLTLLQKHQIAFSEKTHGQLFCCGSSRDILNMLLTECKQAGVTVRLNTEIKQVERAGDRHFNVHTTQGSFRCQSLVVATGGLSIPAIGATPLGYTLAAQFNIKVWPQSPGLVPLTLQPKEKALVSTLSGIAVDAVVSGKRTSFRENILFTHRGLSGPAILQMSSYWQPGEALTITLLPDLDLIETLKEKQQHCPQKKVATVLSTYLPKRLVAALLPAPLADRSVRTLSLSQLKEISAILQQWTVTPAGTEGYRTAEITLGGVDCNAISSKTMEARQVEGLYFTGEILDVSGWLGGYNLQWAWSSGWAAGQYA